MAKREENQKDNLLKQEISFSSWPIPTPEDLEKYDKIIPWLAKELVSMAKKEQDFRHNEISRVNKYEVNSWYLWMIISLFIFLIAICISWFLIYLWKSIEAVIALISTILIFARIFIKWKDYKEETKEIQK